MTPAGANFALIGRSYPCEAYELWFQVSRTARERRKVARHQSRAGEADASKRLSLPHQDMSRA